MTQNFKLPKKAGRPALKKCLRTPRVSPQKGFLLIELLVAMTLFSTIVAIAVGSFINVVRTQRQVSAISAAESNLGIAMEQMAREIRTGSSFCTGANELQCSCQINNECSALVFATAEGHNVEYSLNADSGILEKSVDNGTPQDITGGNVKVRYLNFFISQNVSDNYPRVTIAVGISPNEATLSGNVLNMETTVSARQINP